MLQVTELLSHGARNTTTGRELSKIIGCDMRDITAAVERERRDGSPICASTGANPGYYLAETAEELEDYCDRLHHRAAELHKTRSALLKVLKNYAEVKAGGVDNGNKTKEK